MSFEEWLFSLHYIAALHVWLSILQTAMQKAHQKPPVISQALMFVRDLDTSLLGQNEHGLEQFDTLRKCTDELVNAILHVRQLLKRRRFEGECAIFCVQFCPVLFIGQICSKLCQNFVATRSCAGPLYS